MNVVVVDDDPDHLSLVHRLIGTLEECKVLDFLHSLEALDWCEQNDPDLVIVDYMMPELDGMEFIRRFRGLHGKADTPVVMVTSRTENHVRYAALEIGATDFLTKP